MAALACDVCGGKLVMGAGGTAVCDSCGMEHGKDRMREKIQEIKGTVEVSNIANIESLMKQGLMALEDGKWDDAKGRFDKALGINPEYAPAYAGKLRAEMSGYFTFSKVKEDFFVQVKDDFFISVFKKEADLSRCYKPLDSLPDSLKAIYQKAIRFADDAYKARLEGYNSEIKKRIGELKKEYAFYMVIEQSDYHKEKDIFKSTAYQTYEQGYHIISGACLVNNTSDPLYIKILRTGAEYEIYKTGDGYKITDTKSTDHSLPGHVDIQKGDVIVSTDELLRKKEQMDKQRREEKERKEKQNREYQERKEQEEKWASEGLCRHCGGKLSLFGKKCKSCGKEN